MSGTIAEVSGYEKEVSCRHRKEKEADLIWEEARRQKEVDELKEKEAVV